MHSVTSHPADSSAVGDVIVLTDADAQSKVTIAPERGAIVTSFRVGERELLYMDESTLNDPSKNVRGGVPILFPSPGKLDGDAWSRGGQRGVMKQHGFARNLEWGIGTMSTQGAAAITLTLQANEATRAQYPWDFRAYFTFTLRGSTLRIAQNVQNTSTMDMPFGIGFHPYFRVADKSKARIDTRATRAFDNTKKQVLPFTGFDLTAAEVDIHLLDHGSAESALHLGDGTRIDLRTSEEFTTWVIWTLAGKDFVCLEPWTCPGNALNTGDHLLTLAPGATRNLWFDISLG